MNAFNTQFNLLSPQQTADTLGVRLETLAVWRCTKRYPLPYVKVGKKVFYRAEDITRFIETRLRNTEGLENA